MSPELHLVGTWEDATARLSAAMAERQQSDPLAPLQVLLPSRSTAFDLQRRLLTSRQGVVGGVELFQFYGLARRIVDTARQVLQELNDLAIHRLSAQVLHDMAASGGLTTFRAVQQFPGFRALLIDFVRELKTQGIGPEVWREHALRTNDERDRQLAAFYDGYQEALAERSAVDSDGLIWMAAAALEEDSKLYAGGHSLYVLGFDQFSPVQLRILTALGGRVSDLVVYIQWDVTRDAESLALSRVRKTRSDLSLALHPNVREQGRDGGSIGSRVLEQVSGNVFNGAAAAIEDPDDQLRFVAAPSREAEIRWAVRDAKRLLLDGVPEERIAILAPRPSDYERLVRTIAREYDVAVRSPDPPSEQPVLIALFGLLSLFPEFSWRPVLDALRSPYVHQSWIDAEQISNLDRLTRERPVVSGREQWRESLAPLATESLDPEITQVYDERGPAPVATALGADCLASIQTALDSFFDWVTPLPLASYREHSFWVQEKILGLFFDRDDATPDESVDSESLDRVDPYFGLIPDELLGLTPAQHEPAFAQGASDALDHLLRMVQRLVGAAELVPPEGDQRVTWVEYLDALRDAVASSPDASTLHQLGIQFSPLEEARALSVDHLYVLGLSEGEVPRAPTPDPLFSRQERESHPLPLAHDDPGSEATLWWEVVSASRRRLTLVRPRFDESGAEWLPSPYWRDVVALIVDGERKILNLRLTDASLPEDAASSAEFQVACALNGITISDPSLGALNRTIGLAVDVADARMAWSRPGPWEGVVGDEQILSDLAGRFGEGRPWSASKLNSYGVCPFRFFGESVLSLEPLPDPAEGFDILQRGSLLHAILECTFRSMTLEGVVPGESELQVALDHLDRGCDEVLPSAPLTYGFRSGPLWEREKREIHRLLRALIEWEWDPSRACGYRPYLQEMKFGMWGSGFPPLRLRDDISRGPHDTRTVIVRGAIDRVDRSPDGHLRVIDYKSGSEPFSSKDITEGRALQSALYALAAERLLAGAQVEESYYLHIPRRAVSGKVRPSGAVESDPVVAAAIQRAVASVDAVLDGWFPAGPSKPGYGASDCSATCDFSRLCRVDRRSILKARHFSPLSLRTLSPGGYLDTPEEV